VQRLVLRKFARGEAAGQIEGAELERGCPVQPIDVTREHWAKLAGLRGNSKVYRTPPPRGGEGDAAGKCQRPPPCQAVWKITETFAEKNPRLEQVGCIGADSLSP